MQHGESVRAGDTLDGKYFVEALIGRGGMGSVFRARHIRLDSPRAIKLMRPELADDEDFVRRFKNEALLAEGVRHPNVVALYDFATLADGTRFIVWEYVEGETIGDLLSSGGTFSSEDVRDLVGQVAHGLSAAHQKGVLHRDVSPDNIMVVVDEQSSRVAKLLDFGLAKAVGYPASVPTNPSIIFGKIGFASPEQMGLLGGDDTIDERTDIFSLAAVACAMLTGHPPFSASSLKSFLHDLMIAPEEEVRSRYLEGLPAPWREPLSRALSRDRAKRPPTVEAFLADIDGAQATETSERAARGDRPSRPSSRLRFYLSVGTGILLFSTGAFLASRSVALGPIPAVPAPHGPPTFVPKLVAPKEATRRTATTRGTDVTETEAGSNPTSYDEPGVLFFPSLEEMPPKVPPLKTFPVEDEGVDVAPPQGVGPSERASDEAPERKDGESAAAPPPEPKREEAPIVEPRRIVYVQPVYPGIAVDSDTEGEVVLRIRIDPEGNVTVLGVERSASKLLEKPAVEAVEKWKYAPVEAPMTVTVTVRFGFL